MITWQRRPSGQLRGAFLDHFGNPGHISVEPFRPNSLLILGTDQSAMFLHREQVAQLLPDLVEFVRSGKLLGPQDVTAIPIRRAGAAAVIPITRQERTP